MSLGAFFGIAPPRLPYSDTTAPVEALPVPSRITLLWNHQVPSDLALQVGDDVKTGQDLARPGKGSFISTVTGRIEEISSFIGPDKDRNLLVKIRTQPKDLFDTALRTINDFLDATPLELRTAVTRAGFDTFRSIAKDLSIWPPVKVLIISALDRDPLSISNQQVFRDNPDQVEAAIGLLLRSTGASRCILAIPGHLSDIAGRFRNNKEMVQFVPPIYPNGLPEILARKYAGGILMKRTQRGVSGDTMVVSTEHAIGMISALGEGRPLFEKTVTLSSGKNGKMQNFRVRIGTPVGDIIEKAGIRLLPEGKLIMDGTMRGYACYSDQQPITASTESIHSQAPTEVYLFQNRACTNCGRCNAICPVDLEVNFLGKCAEYGLFSKCQLLGAENCIECGLCAYVCPAHRPLVQLISHAKHTINTEAVQKLSREEGPSIEEAAHPLPAIRFIDTAQEKEEALKE